MKNKIIKNAGSPLTVAFCMLLLLIFIAAMKHPSAKERTSYSYLALGDSYTIGEQVASTDNFPSQLISILDKQGIHFKTPDIIAKTGWTTGELQDAIKKAAIREKYDLVTLLIGVNNQYRGRDIIEYTEQFEQLLKDAIRFAGNDTSHVIVLSIPDWGVTPFAKDRDQLLITSQIDAYNAINHLLAKKYNVHYIDITPGTRLAATDHSLLAPDGLHPSGKEYALWAAQVSALIKQIL